MENIDEIDIEKLVTVKSFAKMCNVTTSFIYKLKEYGKIDFIVVDGVCFVDKVKYEFFSDVTSTRKLIKKLKHLIKSKQND